MIIDKELILILLVCLSMGIWAMISDWRRKRQEERQARLLNSIKFKNSQS
tara:strand:- start:27 stop:176 length:150 start_codon:yes stop_codon:yes gene_type:complete